MRENPPDLKILLVVPYTVPDYSGSGINAFNFARFLAGEGHQPMVLTLNRNMQYRPQEMINGVNIRRIRYYNRNYLTKILSLLLILPVYARTVFQHRLVYIYGGHVIAYQSLIFLGLVLNRKVVFQSLLMGEDDPEVLIRRAPGIFRFILRVLFRRLHRYHAINPKFAEIFQRTLKAEGERVLLHTQGADTQVFKPVSDAEKRRLRSAHGFGADDQLILSVGFVIRRKGLGEVIEALTGWEEDFTYLILGAYDFSGRHFLRDFQEEAAEIMDKGDRLLGGKLRFLGSSPDTKDYMQMSDLLIVSGIQEGLPNTLLEAMACGCKVLVRDLPGIRDFVIRHGENGVIFKDPAELQHWIRELTVNAGNYKHLGRNARDYAERFGSFEAAWMALLETIQ